MGREERCERSLAASRRFLGIDVGCETISLVEVVRDGHGITRRRAEVVPHEQEPSRVLTGVLHGWRWETLAGAAVTGRYSGLVALPRLPSQAAQARGLRFRAGDAPATIVSIGSHGFSVLELRDGGVEVLRENSRCSQGTGSFLRQLVERFGMTVEEASDLVGGVDEPAPLSGRCPVILKTDMTHLANVGESRARILAGLFDAVCENVQVLIKPRLCPARVALVGGVSRAPRVRAHFRRFLERHGMEWLEVGDDDRLTLEALGCAVYAAENPAGVPPLSELTIPPPPVEFDRVPSLAAQLERVRRMPLPAGPVDDGRRRFVVLGIDIGSTGSKAVALDVDSEEVVWREYGDTRGDPVGAAQALVRSYLAAPAAHHRVLGAGVTGSGREIVSSLLRTCYGPAPVFVLNEIAAHAAGASHYDPEVDTIFEIGGQDAKYIRLDGGRVVDAAMNEACSAGTGSFIAEQGGRFAGIDGVERLAEVALEASEGISLGQHCSVFMAEVIDQAVANRVPQPSIVAGIYDSVIQNYLNRVKGSRTVGRRIFCQGMPFSSPALAAAVARQTGSEVVVPPEPGMTGALGIALIARRELDIEHDAPLDLRVFLSARLLERDSFVCMSTKGCGGAGNRCRIERIRTEVEGRVGRFTWGGACSLHEKGTGRRKLPDLTPDPFRGRQELVDAIISRVSRRRGRPTVGLSEEFVLKSLFPFFATFLDGLGFDVVVASGGTQGALRRGVDESNVPYCAPLQLYHGLVAGLADGGPDYLLLPRLRDLPLVGGETRAYSCPLAQGSADLLRRDLPRDVRSTILDPLIRIGPGNLRSPEFVESCAGLAESLGVGDARSRRALGRAREEQEAFDRSCLALGREVLAFCREHGVLPVVVLGRPYTIHNAVLNSNVPAILREQGAVPIPVDCYPVPDSDPVYEDIYWGHGQRTLRAAAHVRREEGVYSLFCSNYSCGPDSFIAHFYIWLQEGKPFALIETDGHSGDAGTKTRVEAFLYCAREDAAARREAAAPRDLQRLVRSRERLEEIRRRGDRVLVPRMGDGSEVIASCLQGLGLRAECLPAPDADALERGRRHTSGKECLPMAVTLGSFLERIERHPDPNERWTLLMPAATGPCRFGLYNLLLKVIVERLGAEGRIRVWAPDERGYFTEAGDGFEGLIFSGLAAVEALMQTRCYVRPVERRRGAADEIYERASREIFGLMRARAAKIVGASASLLEAATGNLFGCSAIVERAAREFARVADDRDLPTVLLAGEIFVRFDPLSNDRIVERLEERGLRVRLAPFTGWFEYTSDLNLRRNGRSSMAARLSRKIQARIIGRAYQAVARELGGTPRQEIDEVLGAAEDYLSTELWGEAVLTIGEAVHLWRTGEIDGAISMGPLECMPNKLAEAQLFHAAEEEGLRTMTISVTGEPIDLAALDSFAFQVGTDFHRRSSRPAARAF